MRQIEFFALWIQLAGTWAVVCATVSYSNYRVYTVKEEGFGIPALTIPKAKEKPSVLSEHHEYDKSDKPYTVRSYLIHHSGEQAFRRVLGYVGAQYNVSITDLGKEIEEERKSYNGLGMRMSSTSEFVAENYYTYEEMTQYIMRISTMTHPVTKKPLAVVEPIGNTYEERKMYLVKISSDHSAGKPIIFFEAGIHAREWTAPAAALYIIHQLVENYTLNANVLDYIDFYIIPLSNPDGYEYSQSTDRLWRKTRSIQGEHYGVDGNRNFGFHWGEEGTSRDPKSEIYIGPYPFSEYETRNIRDAGIKYKKRINTYVAIHAYGPCIAYPWSYKRTAPSPQSDIMNMIGRAAAEAIKQYNGTEFKVGTSSYLMYEAAGGSDDYFKGVLGVDLSFTFELSSGGRESFLTPANKVLGVVAEAYEGFKVMAAYASKYRKQGLE